MSLHRHPSCLDLVWMTDPLESGGAKVGFWSAGQFSGPVSSGTEPSLLRPCCWPPFMCRTHNRDTWGRRSAECDAMQTTSPSVFRLDWARLACDFGRQRIHGYTAWSDSRQTAAQHGESHRPCCFLASLGACFGCRWRHGSFPMNAAEEGGLCSSFPRPPADISRKPASPGCRFRDVSTKPGNALRGQESSLHVDLYRCFPQTSHGN